MLYEFDHIKEDFVRVIPHEFKHARELAREAEARGLSHEDAVEAAFETMRREM